MDEKRPEPLMVVTAIAATVVVVLNTLVTLGWIVFSPEQVDAVNDLLVTGGENLAVILER